MIKLRNIVIPSLAVVSAWAFIAFAAEQGSTARGPAPTLTRPTSAEKAPDADEFMQRWLILEPIRANGLTGSIVQAAVKTEYFPNQFTVIPRDGDKVTIGDTELTWHAVDTKNYNLNLYHFAYSLNRPTSFVLFWAFTSVNCPQEMSGEWRTL